MPSEKDTLGNWRDFWKRLENQKGIQGKTPSFTKGLVSWLFRELHGDETYKSLARWKCRGNTNEENDRLAIGMRPKKTDGKVQWVAFSLFPGKGGQLLFLLYAVNAQESGKKSSESDLREWLDRWELPLVLSECIFPGRKQVGREEDLGLDLPYERYAKIAIRDFDRKNFSFVGKSSRGSTGSERIIRVSAADVLKLLLFEIEHRLRLKTRRAARQAKVRRSR